MWVDSVLPPREFIKQDTGSKACFWQKGRCKRKPESLPFYLGAKELHQPLFFPLVLQNPLEVRWGRNFSISWSWRSGPLRPYENFEVGPFSSFLKDSFFFSLFIIDVNCHAWSDIFFQCVPFVCKSKFFVKILLFS